MNQALTQPMKNLPRMNMATVLAPVCRATPNTRKK